MFNKSFANMRRDLSSGQGIGVSIFGGNSVTKNDVQHIRDFDTAMKNGSTTAQAWQEHMTGCTVAAKQQAKQCLINKGSLTELANGLQQTTVKAKLATVGLKALSIAGNMLLFAGISMGISALFKGIDYLIHRNEKLQEALEESASEFNEATDEVKELETRITELGEKIADLQRLADNGTISVADEKQLELLKDENEELERQLALKQAQQAADARDVLKDAKKTSKSTVTSKYSYTTRPDNSKQYRQVTAGEELTLAIAAFNNGDKDASSRIEDMYEKIAPTIEAYEDLIAAGIKLEGEDKVLYNQLKKNQDAYLMYAYNINGTKEAFAGLNEEQQKTVLLNRLIKQGLSEDYAKAIINSINPEDLDKYWDANFKFTPPDPNDYDSAEEYGKAYAEAWAKSVEDNVQGSTFDNKMTVSLSEIKTASDNISALSSAFKEFSDDGYLSVETISKIQEATKLSGDEWESYKTKLLNAKAGSAEFDQIMSEMTYKILDATFKKEGLVDAIEDEITAVLRENGVLNAEAIAHDYVTQSVSSEEKAKAQLRIQESLNEDSIENLIKNLSSEAAACGITEIAFKNLIAQMIIANETDMPLDKQILALQKLGYAADVARVKVNMATGSVTAGKDYYVNGKNIGGRTVDDVGQETINGKSYIVYYDTHGKVISREEQESYNPSEIKIPNYSGATSSGKSSSSSSKNSALDNYLKDAENRYKVHQDETKYINDLNYALQNLVKTKEEELDVTGKINEAYRDLADNRIKDIEHQNELLLNQGKTEKDLITNYKEIQKIASEEANRLRALGYDDNSNEIQALQKTWWDAENKIAEAPLSIVDSYDTALSQIERKANEIDLQLQKAEANGLMASARYYETMAKYETETLAKLREEKMALTNALKDAVNVGDIEVGTDAWYKMSESIDEVTESILSSELALSEFNKKMKQIVSDRFDYFVDNFSRLTDEADYLIELMGEDLHTDNGQLNDKGISSAGLHGLNYNVYMEKALSYANELKRVEDEITSNPNDISLLERREQLLELQRESVLMAQDERQAIVDLVQQGIDLELNALQELINKYNESLDSAKDLYDYQKRIGEQTDNIASLEKQLSAYEGDTSEETRAKIQQLKVQLESAKDDLKDTEYERYVGEQKKLLDDLYGDLEETLNEKIEDIDGIVENVIDKINSNSKTIANTLKSESAKYGSSISQEMKSVWTSEKQALNDYFGNGSSIGGFALGANGFFNGVGTNTVSGIVSVLTDISNDVNKILREASIVAQTGMDSETTKNQMIQNSKDWFIKDETGRKELESENQKYGSALGYTYQNGTWYDSNGNIAYGVSTNEKISTIVSKMRQNGADWHVSSDSGKKQLEDENNRLAQQIENLSGKSVTKDSNGIWWIGNQELFKTYKTGGLVDYTGLAKLDGTPSKPELVLNAQDTQNFIALNDTLRNIQSQGLNLAALNHYSLADMVELPSIPDFSHLSQSKSSSIGDVHINIEIDHVDDYNDLVNKMRNDKQFEKMIQSVSVDLLSGKSSLAKNKYKW